MLENITSLKVKKEDRKYQMMMPSECQLGEVFDVLSEMRAYVFELIKKHQESSSQEKEKESEG